MPPEEPPVPPHKAAGVLTWWWRQDGPDSRRLEDRVVQCVKRLPGDQAAMSKLRESVAVASA